MKQNRLSRFLRPLLLGCAGLLCVFSAQAQALALPKLTDGSSEASVEQWRNSDASAALAAAADTASVVFYRPTQGVTGPAVNIYVNGEYQGSLLPGAYTQATVCPGTNRYQLAFTNARSRYVEKESVGQAFAQQASRVDHYLVRQGADQSLQLQPLTLDDARIQMGQSVRQQRHTVPRVDRRGCAAATPVAVTEKFTLDANALFPFDQGELATMLPAGRKSIADMVSTLKQRKVEVKQLTVTGHTDPEGSAAYNQALSERRANAVAAALTQEGISASVIRSVGKGKTQPLVADCAARFKVGEQRNACNQPNRRVEIDLQGLLTR